jgi:hypothetical protein
MADVHRVRVVQSGGFAGLTRRYEVEAAKLDPAQSRRLDQLVAALPGSPAAGTPQKGQADRFQYDLEVETKAGARQWRVPEAAASPEHKALIDWIKATAKPG